MPVNQKKTSAIESYSNEISPSLIWVGLGQMTILSFIRGGQVIAAHRRLAILKYMILFLQRTTNAPSRSIVSFNGRPHEQTCYYW